MQNPSHHQIAASFCRSRNEESRHQISRSLQLDVQQVPLEGLGVQDRHAVRVLGVPADDEDGVVRLDTRSVVERSVQVGALRP